MRPFIANQSTREPDTHPGRFDAALRAVAVLALSALALLATGREALTHPHVYLDGSVELVLAEGATLQALEITWLYDEFETLFLLSSSGLSLNGDGQLNEADQQALTRQQTAWLGDFDTTTDMSIDGASVPLHRPTNVGTRLIEGRLEVTFTLRPHDPVDLERKHVEVALYDPTYFHAISVSDPPSLTGHTDGCLTELLPFDPGIQLAAFQTILAQLGREETPPFDNVGKLFADRIVVQCA